MLKSEKEYFMDHRFHKLMMDDSFTDMMNEIEEVAWNTFKEVVKKFLGNIKDPLYK
jgi:hypothetical protein